MAFLGKVRDPNIDFEGFLEFDSAHFVIKINLYSQKILTKNPKNFFKDWSIYISKCVEF